LLLRYISPETFVTRYKFKSSLEKKIIMRVMRPTTGTGRTQTASRFGESVVLAHVTALLTVRQSPAPLVTVATSDKTPGTVNPKAMASTGTSAISVSVSDYFWSNTSAISSRSRQNELKYAVEGYIQNIKIKNEEDTTIIKAKAYRSQIKSEKPHDLFIICNQHSLVD